MVKNKTSERWLEVLSELKLQKIVESDAALAKSVNGLTKQKLYNVKVGDNGVKLEILEAFFEAFPNVNANYVLTGKGSMFLEDEKSVPSDVEEEYNDDTPFTYDELLRLYKTTVSRYERLFDNLKSQFNGLEHTIAKASKELDQAIVEVRNVLEERKTA